MQNKQAYITTPIFYVNGVPHIGHAYTDIIADCIARLHVLIGYDVRSQTGTDEHGQKVFDSAIRSKKSPIQFCNEISNLFYELAIEMNCISSYPVFDSLKNFNLHQKSLDIYKNDKFPEDQKDKLFCNGKNFIRTTDGRDSEGNLTKLSISQGRHIKAVISCWNKLKENGWLYKDSYSGWYSVTDEAFYSDSELINGKAPTGANVVMREEESYFFKLSKFQKILLDIHNENSIIMPSNMSSEIKSFLSGLNSKDAENGNLVEGHLKDLSMSRIGLSWGVPVPDDPNHVIYVWIDALVNYISAIDYPDAKWEDFWNNSKVMHVIGKDILRFHAIYWPAILIGMHIKSDEFEKIYQDLSKKKECISQCFRYLPDKIVVNGWWTNNGEKISKSLGNTVDPHTEIDWIVVSFDTDIYVASDYFRYFLVNAILIGNDGDYNRDIFIRVIESDLCNSVGNLINRVFSILKKNCNSEEFFDFSDSNEDLDFFKNIASNLRSDRIVDLFKEYHELVLENRILDICSIAIEIANNCNAYIEKIAPWALLKTNKNRFNAVMKIFFLNIVLIMQLLRFVIPNIAEKFFDYIKLEHIYRRFPFDKIANVAELRNRSNSAKAIDDLLLLYFEKSKEGKRSIDFSLPILFPKKKK